MIGLERQNKNLQETREQKKWHYLREKDLIFKNSDDLDDFFGFASDIPRFTPHLSNRIFEFNEFDVKNMKASTQKGTIFVCRGKVHVPPFNVINGELDVDFLISEYIPNKRIKISSQRTNIEIKQGGKSFNLTEEDVDISSDWSFNSNNGQHLTRITVESNVSNLLITRILNLPLIKINPIINNAVDHKLTKLQDTFNEEMKIRK